MQPLNEQTSVNERRNKITSGEDKENTDRAKAVKVIAEAARVAVQTVAQAASDAAETVAEVSRSTELRTPVGEISRINISVAEIKKDIGYIKNGLDEMKYDVKNLKDGFVTRAEYMEFKAMEHVEFKKQVNEELSKKVEYSEFNVYAKAFWILAGATAASVINSVFDVIRIK